MSERGEFVAQSSTTDNHVELNSSTTTSNTVDSLDSPPRAVTDADCPVYATMTRTMSANDAPRSPRGHPGSRLRVPSTPKSNAASVNEYVERVAACRSVISEAYTSDDDDDDDDGFPNSDHSPSPVATTAAAVVVRGGEIQPVPRPRVYSTGVLATSQPSDYEPRVSNTALSLSRQTTTSY